MGAIDKIIAMNWRDVVARAAWTFLQAFLAVFIMAGDTIINSLFAGDWAGLQALMITISLSALAAGLSAVKTILVEVLNGLKKAI